MAEPVFNTHMLAMFTIHNSLWILAGYLLGSVSTAIIVCRLAGYPDPRTQGSGNPGATNVLRFGGKKAAALTLAGDMLKGVIAVLAVKLAGGSLDLQIAVGMACFIGHCYPVFFGFKGGKGVATYYGVLLGFSWLAGAAALLLQSAGPHLWAWSRAALRRRQRRTQRSC